MRIRTTLIAALAPAVLLSGCQSSRESMDSAYIACDSSGLRPGTWQHERCTQNLYQENRRKADQAAAAVAVGVAAGAIGAYAISEASKERKERRDRWDRRNRYQPQPVRDRHYDIDNRSGRPVYPVYGQQAAW